MPATPALSAAPPNALLIWTNGRDIFIEMPGPQGLPVVLRYSLGPTGLANALGILTKNAHYTDKIGQAWMNLEPTKQPGTAAQRDNARAILHRMGVIK